MSGNVPSASDAHPAGSAHPAGDAQRPSRRCYKCGRQIGPDESICEVCNRAGMATPSATQYHGTVVVAIIVGVIALAVWGSLALRGVGPYAGSVTDLEVGSSGDVRVTLRITNEGTSQGFASCLLSARDASGRVFASRTVSLGPLAGGATSEFTEPMSGLAQAPESVTITCDR